MMFDVLVASLLAAILNASLMTLSIDAERLNRLGRQRLLGETQLADLEGRQRLALRQGLDARLPLGKLCDGPHSQWSEQWQWIEQWCAANQSLTPPGHWPSSVCVAKSIGDHEVVWVASESCRESGAVRITRRWSLWTLSTELEATL